MYSTSDNSWGVLPSASYTSTAQPLPFTPAAVALHYDKRPFQEMAGELRAAGLDPDRLRAAMGPTVSHS